MPCDLKSKSSAAKRHGTTFSHTDHHLKTATNKRVKVEAESEGGSYVRVRLMNQLLGFRYSTTFCGGSVLCAMPLSLDVDCSPKTA